jgi:hypothetical protein
MGIHKEEWGKATKCRLIFKEIRRRKRERKKMQM